MMLSKRMSYRKPVTVRREITIVEAAGRMNAEGVGSVLVTEGDRLVGIVTDRDLAMRVISRRMPYDARVDAVMTCGVVTVSPDATQADVLAIFREHAIRRLPVVDAGKLIGMITLDDLLADATAAEATDGDLDQLVAVIRQEIGRPRHEANLPQLMADATSSPPRPGRWQAQVGDQLVVYPHTGHHHLRDAEILAVHSPAGDPPFLVRWVDNGHRAFVYPGPDAEIRHLARQRV